MSLNDNAAKLFMKQFLKLAAEAEKDLGKFMRKIRALPKPEKKPWER